MVVRGTQPWLGPAELAQGQQQRRLMPPWAGQGLNTGIRDATNIAWKIAAVINKGADPGILATYDAERRPHAQAMIDLSTAP
jgi:3-(3-hydroxy-phenyl)propionate hydroxylase